MANPNKFEDVITLQLAPGPKRTPEEQRVMEETLSMTARHARRRVEQNMVIQMADERSRRIQRGMESIDANELREMIAADLTCDKEKWGTFASGTMALLDRQLGMHPRIPREKLRSVNPQSKTLVRDVLLLAEGANQDIGFFLEQESEDGASRKVGFDELDLRHLQASMAQ